MDYLVVGLIWILNFAISWWNAYAVGKSWVETKHYGGWPRMMSWCGAIMSASGFTWCYLIVLALGAHSFNWLNERQTLVCLQIGYVIIIPGVLWSGLMITVDSWANAYRNGGFGNYGVAAYNTYAQIHNTYNAIQGFGDALGSIVDFFKGDSKSSSSSDDDNSGAAALLLIVLVIAALAGGIITTAAIIQKTAGNYTLPPFKED